MKSYILLCSQYDNNIELFLNAVDYTENLMELFVLIFE